MQNDKDLFAPPTAEELRAIRSNPVAKIEAPDLFAPPTKEEMAAIRGPEITAGDSRIRGATQGATLGFADEVSGGVEALWEKAKGNKAAFGELYAKYRDESRANFEAAKKANPGNYLGGEIAGGIATAFVPGLNVAKGASLAKVALQSAALGGAAGAGYSNAETAGGVAGDAATGAVIGGALGAGASKAGQYISKSLAPSKIPGGAAPKLDTLSNKANAPQIKAAVKRLGIELTDSQLLDDGFLQKLDSLLQQSPTLVGRKQAGVVKKGWDTASRAAAEGLEGATDETASAVGEKVKAAVAAKIREEKKPISMLYEKLRESTQHMGLSDNSLKAISRNVRNLREGKLGPTKGLVSGIADDIDKLKTVDDVKFLRTQIRTGLQGTASPAEKNAIAQIDRKLRALEEGTVIRTAKNFALNTKDKKAAKEILGLVDERRMADRQYAQFMGKLSDFSGVIKGGKVGTPEGFVQKIEGMGEEELTKRLFSKGNAKGLKFVKENFAEEAEQIFALEKRRILDKFGKGEKLDARKLVNEVFDNEKYAPEVREMMFKPEQLEKMRAAKTYFDSLGPKANPSETTTAKEILSFWNPMDWPKSVGYTARDLLIKGVLKTASNLDSPGVEAAMRTATAAKEGGRKALSKLEPAARPLRNTFTQNLSPNKKPYVGPDRRKIGEEEKKEEKPAPKGQEKWAEDGAKKLLQSGISEERVEKLRSTPEGKKSLISASDLTPGSKAWKALVERIGS